MTLGERIFQYRTQNGLSQRRFADQCNLSNGYIAMLEKGVNPATGKPLTPNLDTIKSIADAMGMELGSLLEEIDDIQIDLTPKHEPLLSVDEREVIRKLRLLDDRGLATVLHTLDFEVKYLNR